MTETNGWMTPGGSPPTDTEAGRYPHESPRSADVEARLPDADIPTDAHAERTASADRADHILMERAATNIGILTGVLGVLLAVGFVFLPAGTLPEKAYVLFACIALSVAAVAGIGARRSARRFALTVTSACVAVVCLAALLMAAQHDQPSPPTGPTRTSGSASATPTVSPAALPAGSVVFADDFMSNKGWDTGRAPDGGGMEAYEPGALHATVAPPILLFLHPCVRHLGLHIAQDRCHGGP